MSTAVSKSAPTSTLSSVPDPFRARLLKSYNGLKSALAKGDHDAAGLRGGVFAEAVLRFLQNELTGSYVPFGEKIVNFSDSCLALERLPKTAGNESLRILMPRALNFLYTLRNKRGIGHAGGDVDANEIDAATCARLADWCISELIRIFHRVSIEEAQEIVNTIAERQISTVWYVVGKKRILQSGLDFKAQTLLLLYSDLATAIPAEDLYDWTEYSSLRDYRRNVLSPLHTARFVEYDRSTETVMLSPKGIAEVEDKLLIGLKLW